MRRALAADPGSPSGLAPLRNPIFRSVWLATQISSVGSLMQTVAVSWLMATISTSDLMVALVQASSTLPAFLLSIFAGAIADNFSRRRVMLAGRCLIATSSAMLTVLLATGFVDPWSILGLSFLAGCGVAFNGPAWQASVGDMVDRRDIPAAVMLISAGFNTIRAIGPALGGIVVASFAPLIAVALATVGNAAPLAAIARCKWKVRSSPLPREPITTAIYDGMRFAMMSSEIRAVMAQGTLFGLASIAILALLPLVVRDQLGGGPFAYGVLMAGFGTGAFLAGSWNGFFRRVLSQGRLIAAACVACAACSASLALTQSVAAAAVALGMGGAGWVTAWSWFGTNVQLASPQWVVGRSLSIYYASTYGGIAAGSWLWGVVAENQSLSLALEGSAGALLLAAAASLVLPIGEAQDLELYPSDNGFNGPKLALDLKPRSGPIVARIEYWISAKNVEAFLDLMPERRMSQSRAGARHWNLQRDVQEPSHWIETFRTPTWTDYLRLNHRLTIKDNQLDERLSQLHSGEHPRRLTLSIERPVGSARKPSQPRPFISHPPLG
ncbi:MFS transporter [Bradyrhizobium sp. 141]|uniref:MFS transporter n=1 Tax=Bradyrhizobium sp. 141 TaxID=2782617 RepID=UPI001FF72182|nr:MFS transporter [Bradyrhizobium sp. 141]MCK1721287.1 MFS transporter [Bradyrhizobium sp. 141]